MKVKANYQNALNKRKSTLLNFVVREYIQTAEPVGSLALARKHNLGLSPATLRNEMAELTRMDFLYQPHTSAGRIPTERAYRYFVKHCLETETDSRSLLENRSWDNSQFLSSESFKAKVKDIADYIKECVFIAFEKNDVYYTGLSYLFRQPEFESYDLVCHLSEVLDRFDEIIYNVWQSGVKQFTILVGNENPFSRECSVLLLPCQPVENQESILGILGPMRMDYEKAIVLMKELEKTMSNV